MSISLISNTDSLQVVLDATPTNQCPVNVTYAQQGALIGEGSATTNGATAVTLLTGPSSGNGYAISSIQFPNADTTQRTLTVNKVTSSGTRLLYKATVSAGSALMYDGGAGWYVMDQFGNRLSSASLAAGVTISQPNIVGVTNGGNATAGSVGEFITSTQASTSISTSTYTNITSIALTPGDWDVFGSGALISNSTAMSVAIIGSGTSSASAPTFMPSAQLNLAGQGAFGASIPTVRVNVTANTTIYLIGYAQFSSGTATMSGTLSARRIR